MTVTDNTTAIQPRTLGLPHSAERALMGKAYENYATAQRLQKQLHNEWRRVRSLYAQRDAVGSFIKFNDDNAHVQAALTKATESALHLANAKTQYRQAKAAARQAVAR